MGTEKDNLDKVLEELAKRGLVDFPVTEEFVTAFEQSVPGEKLSDEEIALLYKVARSAYQDSVIAKVRESLPVGGYTLGQYVRLIREKTKLSLTEISDRTDMPFTTLKQLEENSESPEKIPVPKLCNLMELFRLGLSELVSMVERSLGLLLARGKTAQAQARSMAPPGSRDRGAVTSEALDMLLIKANTGGSGAVRVEQKLIEEITRELQGRGRQDLLK
jgi:transcriptional regulator with XRE-family HTH domain